jgi:acyl-CoA synthetase (AMP-forming)/AMP-acid ligase II
MNLALWLERAGISHGDRPALGSGSRVVRSYAECAGRVARLAASLRQRFGLEAGERVAIVAKNSPDYLELMFGIWHAGLAAVATKSYLDAFAKLEAGDPGAMAAFAAHVGRHADDQLASFHLRRLLNGATSTRIVMD